MKTKRCVGLVYRLALAVCLAAGILSGQALPASMVSAAGSSTWYWQNPLPRPYSVNAIACASATHCVAMGIGGATLRTSDGGRHWTAGTAGAGFDIYAVSCPSQVACYALGNTNGSFNGLGHLLKSVDSGATWQDILLAGPGAPRTITCPSAATCLLIVSASDGSHMLRTADGGHTWADVFQGPSFVSCTSRQVCYAEADRAPTASAGTTRIHTVYRSEDAGRTWTQFAQSQKDAPSCSPGGMCLVAGLGALSCSSAGFCLAALNTYTYFPNCGCDYQYQSSDLFVVGHGATWVQAHHTTRGTFGFAACAGPTTCYYLAQHDAAPDRVLRTTDGGKTWATFSLHIDLTGGPISGSPMACPAAGTCYVSAGFTLVMTTDGFHHVAETPAKNAIGNRRVDTVQCPTRSTCYADGAPTFNTTGATTSLVATNNGGHTWTARPDLPWGVRLSCPSSKVCYGFHGHAGGKKPIDLYRTRNGARHWQRLTIPAATGILFGVSCPAVDTCYVGIWKHDGGAWRATVVVTRDGGTRWALKPAFDSAASIILTTGSLSCPSVTTCFAVVYTPASTISGSTPVLMETKDRGQRWIRVASFEHTLGTFIGSPDPLICPTVTSCYVQSPTNQDHAAIMTTHDGSATWHRSGFGPHLVIRGIACATAAACRVLTQGGIYSTSNGGKSWREQALPMGGLGITGIACPRADTCYAVGGMNILATHRP